MPQSSSERSLVELLADDFLARHKQGDRPTIREYCDKHPELADEIRDVFEALLMVEDLKPGSSDGSGSHGDSVPVGGKRLEQVGDYRILAEIGRGGMGVVYEAEQQALGRRVALKVLLRTAAGDGSALVRFQREAKAAARMHHTNIVPVFDVGQDGEHLYYVMQLIHGQGLDGVIHDLKRLRGQAQASPAPEEKSIAASLVLGRFEQEKLADANDPRATAAYEGTRPSSALLPGQSDLSSVESNRRAYYRSVAQIGVQTASALSYAHARGIVHRDIKPGNLLLDATGNVWVTDFGLAKTGDVGMTHTGDILGTIRYMAPERFRGQCDVRADVYALGMTLYELLTLKAAYVSGDRLKLMELIRNSEPASPRSIDARVPRDLETIVMKALDKDVRRRYQSADEMVEELQRFVNDEPIKARRVSQAERLWRWCRRKPAVAGLLGAVGLLLVGIAVVASLGYVREATQRGLAQQAEAKAQDEAERATRLAEDESRARQAARRNLYVANMRLAQQAWEGAQVKYMLQLLEEAAIRLPGDDDLRGFEWRYLWRLGHPEVQTFQGHTGRVHSVAFSPDRQRLASASEDGSVRLWGAANGNVLLTFTSGQDVITRQGPIRPVLSVAFSPDGQRLATANFDSTVQLWDAATGKALQILRWHTGAVRSVAFSPNGQRLASGSGDGTVQLWDAATGKALVPLRGRIGPVLSVAFSPDSQRLASGSGDGTVKLWDAANGKELLSLQEHKAAVFSVAFSPDGKRLAAASYDRTVKLWDTSTGEELLPLQGHTNAVESVAFSPDGRTLASASRDRTVKLWDATSGKELQTLRVHTDAVWSVAFSSDGQRLASAGGDGTVKLWEPASSQELFSLKRHSGLVESVAFSPDGQRLASASRDGTVNLWDAATGKELFSLQGHTDVVASVAFSPDGQRLASAGGDGTVQLWDATSGKQLQTLTVHSGSFGSVDFSPDGQRLAFASNDGTVTLWETASGKELQTLQGHTRVVPTMGYTPSVAFSPDGKRLASSHGDRTIKLWDAATGEELLSLPGHTRVVLSVAFSPDGKRLASASYDWTVKLWDTASGKELQTLEGHTYGVSGVAFSPDGKRLASAGVDRTVKLWDAATGKELLSLRGHTGSVWCVAFSPDGQRLASGRDDGTITLWESVRPSLETLRQRDMSKQAFDLLDSLYASRWRRAEVIQALRENLLLTEPLRQAALALTEQYHPGLVKLNIASWAVVRQPGASAEVYGRALLQAEEACRLQPWNGSYLTTLGVAQYRVGQYQAALGTLVRSEKLNTGPVYAPPPADLAFLAMAQYQLNQKVQAQATLARLREAMKKPRLLPAPPFQVAFLREAEMLIEGKAPDMKK
jgi:WD40 repeat protein/serine/threonine protein kinase